MVLKNDDYDITSSQTTAISTKRRTFFRAVAAFAFLVILHAAFNHTWIKPQIQSSHREHRTPEHSLCSQRLSLKQLTLEVTASTVASSLSACTAARLQEAIRINTTSFTEVEATSIFTESPSNAKMKEEKNSASEGLDSFLQFHKFLKKEFPRIHESYNVTTISKASLIFEPLESEPKFLFYAHMDVVPGTGEDPFSGRFNENSGMIHGRGALDMKGILVSFLSALEAVLDACDMESTTSDKSSCLKKAKRWTIALGHDEETGGTHGAAKIAEYLAQKGALFEMILDEGVPATQNLIPLPGNPVIAFIGVAERGYVNCRLTISSEGGHSSVSKWSENPSHVLASTLNILDQKHPFPVHSYSSPTIDTFKLLLLPQWLLTNRLFNIVYDALGFPHIFGNVFSRNAMARPFISSTAAVTQFFAGAEGIMNVVPNTASALINIRVHPSDTAQSIQQHLESALAEIFADKNHPLSLFSYTLQVLPHAEEASPVTPYTPPFLKRAGSTSDEYTRLANILEKVHSRHNLQSKVIVGPAIMVGGTDTKHFLLNGVIKDGTAFRLSPFLLTSKKQLGGIHGVDEFVSMNSVERAIEFYYRMIVEF